jgi:hypothetical protein
LRVVITLALAALRAACTGRAPQPVGRRSSRRIAIWTHMLRDIDEMREHWRNRVTHNNLALAHRTSPQLHKPIRLGTNAVACVGASIASIE